MITDALLVLDDNNATIRGANTYVSTNTVDLGPNTRDVGAGEPLKIYFNVNVAFVGGTQVTIQVINSATANLASPSILGQSKPILTAALTLGASFMMYVPEIEAGGLGQRYLGVQYVSTGTFTAGTISARFLIDTPNVKNYPVGFTVL